MPDCLGTLPSTLCQISAFKRQLGNMFLTDIIFLKWGILNLNVPFCSIFVPFHFYLIMTLVVPCLHNMFMVLLIFALAIGNFKIGGHGTKPIFLDSGSPSGGKGGGSCVWAWFVNIV